MYISLTCALRTKHFNLIARKTAANFGAVIENPLLSTKVSSSGVKRDIRGEGTGCGGGRVQVLITSPLLRKLVPSMGYSVFQQKLPFINCVSILCKVRGKQRSHISFTLISRYTSMIFYIVYLDHTSPRSMTSLYDHDLSCYEA